ncbi:Methionyl-tRNA synthetase, mitochondrial [Temnothorax longispinosus]|uniref:Methionine--tRNA ligase, mitochondrial n=1 Tax=Temnothorax longispinosus TaxID=300112 RepID=A0A4S2KGS5_9HYME|nr:Methionyl-tRNA synthetase, mitochondrial [Temnothorax longispinosus]
MNIAQFADVARTHHILQQQNYVLSVVSENVSPIYRHRQYRPYRWIFMASVLLRNATRLGLTRHLKGNRVTARTSDERCIMTSRARLEKVLEELQRNPYYDKYAEKIARLQQTSPQEFLQRVEQQEKETREKQEKREKAASFYQSEAKPALEPGTQAKEARLDSIMKVDMINDRSKEEIIEIWNEYHKRKDCICGTMTPEQYDKMFARGKQYSTFLLPLPREQGYEFIMCQFYGSEVHMTPLLWYQTHKENAPECLTMIHYTELRDDKGIVLMRGEFDANLLQVQEAQCLANELQLYFCNDNEHRLRLLETFTNRPNEFKHMDLIAHRKMLRRRNKNCFKHVIAKYQPSKSAIFPFLFKNVRSSWSLTIKRHYVKDLSQNKYITTPIFYVNAGPHIGHLYSAVLADAVARYNSMLGHKTFLTTGTDEHGNKIKAAAAAAGLPNLEYCTRISQQFREMCDRFEVDYSRFIRTTEKQHCDAVYHFWKRLEERGHIYLGKYSGWYCVSDEAFLSDAELVEQKDSTGKVIKVSAESGNKVEWTEEENYKFRLSAFQDDLKYWLKDENTVRPALYHRTLSQWVEEGACLQDLSITRIRNKVPWAIPSPRDESHSVYVWMDALVNYLTVLGYPNESYKEFWPPTIQIIGKDILKFHGIYWPAFLIAAGLEPPKTLLCHAHWTVDHKKMSKSKGNVISPFEAANEYSDEGLRYFILREAVPQNDANYSSTKIVNVLNSELADTLGNLVSRCAERSFEYISSIHQHCAQILLSREFHAIPYNRFYSLQRVCIRM